MAGAAAKDVLLLADEHNLTSFLNEASIERDRLALDTSVFGQDSKTFIVDTKDAMVSFGGLADETATGISKILDDAEGQAQVVVTYGLQDSFESYAYLLDAAESEIGRDASISGLLRINGVYKAQEDGGDSGVILLPVTTATATADGSGHDRGAANTSSGGNVCHLHVTAASGTTPTLDVTVEMDTNSGFSTPTTLATFTQATTTTSERIENTTSTERYVRVSYTIGGTTPSFTFAVSWAPR